MENYVSRSIAKIDNRLVYADVLRLVAILAIVVVHSATGALYFAKPTAAEWQMSLLYDSVFNWGTNVFVMMSGLFMLKPSRIVNVGKFYKGRFLRIFVPFLVWAIIYEVVKQYFGDEGFSTKFFGDTAKNLVTGKVKVHLWFVYMIFAMYFITPVLSHFVNNATKSQLKYYFGYWIVSTVLISIMHRYFGFGHGFQYYFELNEYAGFYMLGYVIQKYDFRINRLWFVLIPLLMVLKYYLVNETSLEADKTIHFYRDRMRFNIIPISILMFFLFRQINWEKLIKKSGIIYKFFVKYSALSYGIFLSHMLIIDIFQKNYIGIKLTPYWAFGGWVPLWLGTPFFIFVVVVLVLVLVNIINRIPFVNRLFL
jgi:surface polysaccharide O-acyltransferase-like enzyme